MADKQVAVREVAGDGALALVKQYQSEGALVFVAPEDLRAQRMFLPEIVVIKANPATDFHSLPGGQMMPKSHQVHRMADAGGVTFTPNCGTREGARPYVKVGWAQGKRRMPDGTWRESPVLEYEFDPDLRAEEDFLKDKGSENPKYTTPIAQQKHILELRKFAAARASTGAELRVIRNLCGVPTSFKREDIQRAMVFSRIAINTDAMLDNDATRDAAIAHALGAADSVFGPREGPVGERNVTPEPKAIEAPADDADPDFGDAPETTADTTPAESPEQQETKRVTHLLEDWLQSDAVKAHNPGAGKQSAASAIKALLANKDATIGELKAMLDRCVALAKRAEERKAGGK